MKISSDDKFNEAAFKEVLTIEEQLEYAMWVDTLASGGCSGLESLSPDELDYKMYRMYVTDVGLWHN